MLKGIAKLFGGGGCKGCGGGIKKILQKLLGGGGCSGGGCCGGSCGGGGCSGCAKNALGSILGLGF